MENIEITNAGVDAINALCEKFGIVVDWTAQNVMPYLLDLYERFIVYTIVVDLISIIMSTICLIVTGKASFNIARSYINMAKSKDNTVTSCFWNKNRWGEVELPTISFIIVLLMALAIIISFINLCFDIPHLIQTIFIPEMTMIEKLNAMM